MTSSKKRLKNKSNWKSNYNGIIIVITFSEKYIVM